MGVVVHLLAVVVLAVPREKPPAAVGVVVHLLAVVVLAVPREKPPAAVGVVVGQTAWLIGTCMADLCLPARQNRRRHCRAGNWRHQIATLKGREAFSGLATPAAAARKSSEFVCGAVAGFVRDPGRGLPSPRRRAGPEWRVFDDHASGLVRLPGSTAGRRPAPAAATAAWPPAAVLPDASGQCLPASRWNG